MIHLRLVHSKHAARLTVQQDCVECLIEGHGHRVIDGSLAMSDRPSPCQTGPNERASAFQHSSSANISLEAQHCPQATYGSHLAGGRPAPNACGRGPPFLNKSGVCASVPCFILMLVPFVLAVMSCWQFAADSYPAAALLTWLRWNLAHCQCKRTRSHAEQLQVCSDKPSTDCQSFCIFTVLGQSFPQQYPSIHQLLDRRIYGSQITEPHLK